jgi:response regulator NasT
VGKAKVALALANSDAAEKIKYALVRSGFAVEDVCSSGSEALRSVRTAAPDILLINFDMPDMTGLEAATIVGDENLCSVVLFVTGLQRSFCADVVEEYDITLFPKPVNVEALLSAVETILHNRRRIERLEKELERLRRELDDRKAIDKAKGILMDRKSISEAEAYRRIQKMSMDSRVAMRDIAQKVIELSEKC